MTMTREGKNLREAREILQGKMLLVINEELEAERIAGHILDRTVAVEVLNHIKSIWLKVHMRVIQMQLDQKRHEELAARLKENRKNGTRKTREEIIAINEAYNREKYQPDFELI